MANHCEPTKPELDKLKRDELLNAYNTFIKEIGQTPQTVNLSKDGVKYLKISRANVQAILDENKYCGIAISFGLNQQPDGYYKLTTIVAPLMPTIISAASRVAIPVGGQPGPSEIDWNSPLVCDDLGQGPNVKFLPFADHMPLDKAALINASRKFIDESPSLRSLIDLVLNNPADFESNTK